MKKFIRTALWAAFVSAALELGTVPSFAVGFRNADQGARATGQGEAFVAQADDASAVYYNPSGLTQIQGSEVTVGGMASFPDMKLQGAGTGGEMNTPFYLPHFYAATDFGAAQSPWRFGIGLNVPFGNQAQYADNGPFRYLVTNARLAVFNIEPAVAFRVNNHLSLGVGLNIYDADTALARHVALTPYPDGRFNFNGHGQAFGATAGLMWTITPQHTVGVVYRSPFSINFNGSATLKTPLGTETKGAEAPMDFPQSVAIGYAFRPTKNLKLEADIEWTNWDVLNKLVLHAPAASFNGTAIPFNWQDSLFYEFGAQYAVDEHWTVRGGYIYSENSVPDSTFTPTVPDANRHVFSIGLGYGTTRVNVDVVYQYTLGEDRTVNNGTAASGTWESDFHSVMLTSSLKF